MRFPRSLARRAVKSPARLWRPRSLRGKRAPAPPLASRRFTRSEEIELLDDEAEEARGSDAPRVRLR